MGRIFLLVNGLRREVAVETPVLRMSLELPDQAVSVPLCRRMLRAVLADLAVNPSRAADIEMALSEAITNVVEHAYARPGQHYRVRLEFFSHCVRLLVEDQGRGFVRAAVPEPSEAQPRGRGLWLIEQLADAVTIQTLPGGGCRLEAEFTLAPPPPWASWPDIREADADQ
jgi:serine/threonine-protein kinase RsbW